MDVLKISFTRWAAHIHRGHVKLQLNMLYSMGRDSSVGIATHYGMDGPGIESL